MSSCFICFISFHSFWLLSHGGYSQLRFHGLGLQTFLASITSCTYTCLLFISVLKDELSYTWRCRSRSYCYFFQVWRRKRHMISLLIVILSSGQLIHHSSAETEADWQQRKRGDQTLQPILEAAWAKFWVYFSTNKGRRRWTERAVNKLNRKPQNSTLSGSADTTCLTMHIREGVTSWHP